ncbi:MAG: hypothetical protein ACI9DJ_002412 [Algoriphagus sp.]|jgi:hypothetical protein
MRSLGHFLHLRLGRSHEYIDSNTDLFHKTFSWRPVFVSYSKRERGKFRIKQHIGVGLKATFAILKANLILRRGRKLPS